MRALVRHLHAFAREVRPTDDEWAAGIAFLTAAGAITDARRQEFVLLSDVLGLSALTVAVNEEPAGGATPATVLGPFYHPDAPEVPLGGSIAEGVVGTPCHVSGSVRGAGGTPIGRALLEVWEADADGRYDVQYPDGRVAGRGQLRTGPDGEFDFWSVLPAPYPIPHDGPVGALLAATGRSPMRPAHLHVKASAPGHRTLVTHYFVAGDPHLDSDAVFGVRHGLVVHPTHHDGYGPADKAWASLRIDVVLAPA